MSALLNLVRNTANITSVALATAIVAATMGSMGFEPSLDAVGADGAEEVGRAFTTGLRYAYMTMGGLLLTAMVFSALQRQAAE